MTDILVQQDGPIATVVFNRPAMRNAISLAMWTEIARVTEGLGKDESVRAIVYRGAGTVAFASGADISEFKEQRKDTESALHYNAQTAAAYATIRDQGLTGAAAQRQIDAAIYLGEHEFLKTHPTPVASGPSSVFTPCGSDPWTFERYSSTRLRAQ